MGLVDEVEGDPRVTVCHPIDSSREPAPEVREVCRGEGCAVVDDIRVARGWVELPQDEDDIDAPRQESVQYVNEIRPVVSIASTRGGNGAAKPRLDRFPAEHKTDRLHVLGPVP